MLLVSAYVSVVVMIFTGTLPVLSLATFLSAPMAMGNIKTVLSTKDGQAGTLAGMDIRSAQLHLVFGLLLIASLVVASFRF